MIIVVFHILYLLGKFVYQNYGAKKQKAVDDAVMDPEKPFEISERIYLMVDPETPQYDDNKKPIRFFPPAYVQRYTAVSDVLNSSKYRGTLRKVVDFGCADLNFLVYLKNTDGIEEVLCVDIDRSLLEAHEDKSIPLISEYVHTRTAPLVIEVCEGSVTHNDKKLEKTDAVICIELIEHLYPDTLNDLPYNIFGFIKPKVAIITTPNADFNVLFPNFSGFRHHDHKFEWTRQQFQDWADNIVLRYPDYIVTFHGICKGPEGTEHLGCCTQMAVFHRLSEKDSCNLGIEGLFKTVARHEYPFHVDNRSDEQKILDEAAYYIRHLAFQDCNMDEEVPLKKLWEMLKSFHISIDILRTILEEAGWSVVNREFGPVIQVPPQSTFSDYNNVENELWSNDSSITGEDDWDRDPGPPENSSRLWEENLSSEDWNNENWDEEPSIIIPQNNSVAENNTYLFDGENMLLDSITDTTKDFEILEKYIETNSRRNLDAKPSLSSNVDRMIVDDSNDLSLGHNVPPDLNKSMVLSGTSLDMNLEDTKDSSIDLSAQDGAVSNTAQKLSRMLDFQEHMSVSRASTSPEPYLLQTVKMGQHLRDDSLCNESMSGYWMLNNSLDRSDASKDTISDANDDKGKKLSPKNDLDVSNSLCSIYLNTSYRNGEDSESKNVNSNADASGRCSSTNQTQSVQQDGNFPREDRLQLNNSVSFNSVTIDSQPQFTSSPKIDVKVNTTGKKRRSPDRSEQRNNSDSLSTLKQLQLTRLSSNNSLESTNNASLQSNTDVDVRTMSNVSCSAINMRCNEKQDPVYGIDCGNDVVDHSNDSTFTDSDASTLTASFNDDKQTSKQLYLTESPNKDESAMFTTIEQNETAAINPNNIQSINCDTKFQLAGQQVIVRPETSDGVNTETKSVSQKDTREPVDSTKISCNHAKDVSNLKSIILVSNAYDEEPNRVQSTSVSRQDGPAECSANNRELKCKDASPNDLEIVENIEAKPSSPEAVETPPNSRSPEVMDSGYPNSASAQDMTPEYDLSSIAQDHISDSEPPSIAEAPRLGVLEPVEVENGDLVNNNRDGEGNNMIAVELNDELEDLLLIDVLENDLENENDIYAMENDFPIWLLRILDMANPIDVEMQIRDRREARFPDGIHIGGDVRYVNVDHDEGFDSSSEEGDIDLENNEIEVENNSDDG
ncbi:uncharacterized protein LOC122398197 isoform X1 [Colletes gigas]|uniref:uncharacterized protein LOC122398197 isoform X1 n=1 Tax=Colletes gigas TaxID=935657 RepID=UPI001C9B735A|nr:uncharacterized protein LOC122398197 isoform X1 [Colletes gigas]